MNHLSDTLSSICDTTCQDTAVSIVDGAQSNSPENCLMDYGIIIMSGAFLIIAFLIIVLIIMNHQINKLIRENKELKENRVSRNEFESVKQQLTSVQSRKSTTQTTVHLEPSYEIRSPAHLPELKVEAPKYKYLTTARDGSFRKPLEEPSSKTFFRMWYEGVALRYEFYGNVTKAIENLNAIFDDVCEIEGGQANAKDIKNVSPGILDAQLRIQRKAIIKLI